MNPTIDELQEALGEISSLEYQLQTGNCGKFAIALQNLLGGELIGIFTEPERYYDHVLLLWNGWWWDGDGIQDPDAYVVPALQKEVMNLENQEQDYIEVSDSERALERTSPTEIPIPFLEFLVAEKLGEVSELEDFENYSIRRVKLNDDIYRYQFLDAELEKEKYVLAENREKAIENL